MKFSIITISYNSASTIHRAIESVLNQYEAPYEYIIVDGKSKDETCVIAETYRSLFNEKGINYTIISEPDNGIYDAMNKGVRVATGDVIGMINSDDWYEPHAIQVMNEIFSKNQIDMAYADIRVITKNRVIIKRSKKDKFPSSRRWNHPTTFITKDLYNTYSYKNETIFDDWDLILRIRKAGCQYMVVPEVLANFSFGGVSNNKSLKNTLYRISLKNRIFKQNGYSWLHFLDSCYIEFGKYLLG